jgi:DNA-directed RNA polymerase subunit RPC12/RpoP
MSIKVACQCGKRFTAPPHLAGKSANCPSCGSKIVIAAAPAQPATGPATARPAPPRANVSSNGGDGLVVSCWCGQQLRAPSHLAGQQVPCPVCQQPILVPAIDDPFATLSAAQVADNNLWNDLPQQQAWPAPQQQWSPQQPWPPAQAGAPAGWAPASQEVSPNAALAHQYMANAHRQEVEKTQDMDVWGNGQIFSGILTMTIAVLWFFGGLLVGIIFFLPPIMFVGGMIALINGISQKVSR